MNGLFRFLLVTGLLLPMASTAGGTQILNKEGVIGATTGGVAGSVIGHQSGHRTEGAIIGSVAGYALGTNIHRQKQRQRQLERQLEMERAELRQWILAQKQASKQEETTPRAPLIREYTTSERQQLLLQATPLFRVPGGE